MSSLIALEDAPELKKIDESKALQIKATFEPMVKLVEAVEDERQKVIVAAREGVTKQVMADAKKLRLGVARIRVEGEKKRVAMKQEYLRAGQAVDGANNVLKWAIVGIENEMTAIEKHFENAEKERLKALQIERVELISPYLEDAAERDLSGMETDVWVAYFSTKKQAHDDRAAAEKQAEDDRIAKEKADAEEQERIRLDNERLQKEAEERERVAKEEAAERARVEADRLAKEETARKEREEKARKEDEAREIQRQKEIREREELEKDRVAKAKKEREERESKQREEQEERDRIQREKDDAHKAKLEEERQEKQKLADELEAKEEAEEKEKADAENARQAELSKGDSEKVGDLVTDIEAIKAKYSFDSDDNKKMFTSVCGYLDTLIERIME